MLVPKGLWHQPLDVLADQLVGRVAEDPGHGGIDRLDGPDLVDRDDSIDGDLQNPAGSGRRRDALLGRLLERGHLCAQPLGLRTKRSQLVGIAPTGHGR